MAAQVRQSAVNGVQLLLKTAAHLTGCVGSGIGGVCFDQIDDSLCLGQIQLAVQESPLGEFTTLGRLCAGNVQAFQSGSQHSRAAVAVEFHRILAGIGVGTVGNHNAAVIDGPAGLVLKIAQHQFPVRNLSQGLSII